MSVAAARALAVLAALSALAAATAYGRALGVSYGVYDEGLILYGAQRVLEGAVPYADFWTLYAPGQFYALASLFAAFGVSIAVERVASLATVVAVVVLCALLVRSQTRGLPTLAAGAATTLWLAALPMFGSPLPVAVALALASLLLLDRATRGASRAAGIAAGVAAGAAIWFRHDIGALLSVVEIARIATLGAAGERRDRAIDYAGGLAIALLPGAAWLLSRVPLEALVECLVVFPATGFAAQRALPWPEGSAQGLLFYSVPVLLALCGIQAAIRARAGRGPSATWWSAWAFGVLLLQQAIVRSDLPHMLPSGVLAIAATAALVAEPRLDAHELAAVVRNATLVAAVRNATLVAAVRNATLAVAAAAWLVALPVATAPLQRDASALAPSALARARGISVPPPKQRYERVVRFVQELTPPGAKIFVGNARHDRLHMNDVVFYYLAERDSATPYHELHPGVATTRAVQERIVHDLADVDVVVLANFVGDEPNESAHSSGVTLLDDVIRRDFAAVFEAGGYQVLKRR